MEDRNNLIDRMIAIYGMEHTLVIQFCRLCEEYESNEWNDTALRLLVEAHEADPVFLEE